MNWNVAERAKEPTTWGGLGLLAAAIGSIFDSQEVATVGGAAADAGAAALTGGMPLWTAIILALAGGSMALAKERGAKDAR